MKKVLWLSLFSCIVVSFVFAFQRYRLEEKNRTVEVAMDYDDFKALCEKEGLPLESALLQFKQAGVTSIAVTEMTLEKLYRMGEIFWIRGEDLPLYPSLKVNTLVPYPSVLIFTKNKTVVKELQQAFSSLFSPSTYKKIPHGFLLRGKWEDLSQIGLGIFPQQVLPLEKLGFFVDPRLDNPSDVTSKKIDYLLGTLPVYFVSAVIFSGLRNEVLGYDNNLDDTAQFFKQSDLRFGYIEAYDPGHVQKGSIPLATQIPAQVVKVQALILPPLLRLDPETAVDTFALGVKERNVRIVYFRPFITSFGGMSPLEENLQFLNDLWRSLERSGLKPGEATTFPKTSPGLVGLVVGTLGFASAFFLLLLFFVEIPSIVIALGVLGSTVLTIFLHIVHHQGLWVDLVGFLGAISFPMLSVFLFSSAKPVSFWKACTALLEASALTLCGGLLLSCLLANNLTMLGIVEFRGVKGVLLFPTIFSAWLAWLYHTGKLPAPNLKEFFWRFFEPLKKPAALWHLAFLLFLAGAGGIMLLRSGNEGGALVPSWEKHIRVFLEIALRARPRFKEFAIGHPAFLLALLLGIENPLGFFFLLGGSLGQADIMDSFAHLHTPLFYTFLRTFHGLWLGVFWGFVFSSVLRAGLKIFGKEGAS